MKVVVVMYRDDVSAGGSLRVGETLAKGIQMHGAEVHIIFAYPSVRSRYDVLGWIRLRRQIQRLKPDVIHFIDPLIALRLALTGIPGKRVGHVHGSIIRVPLKTRLQWRLIQSRDEATCFVSKGARSSYIATMLVDEEKAAVVYNAVDYAYFQERPTSEEARWVLDIPLGVPVLGSVGRLFEARGFDDMLGVLALLPNWHGLIVGGGEDRARLEGLAKAKGLADRVTFAGPLRDVRVAYAAMDAYAFLPLYESFGLAMAEAMACRVPIFGLDCPGEYRENLISNVVAEFVAKRSRRLFVEPEKAENLQLLANRLHEYVSSVCWRPIVNDAERHVQNFSVSHQGKETLMIYEHLVYGHGPLEWIGD